VVAKKPPAISQTLENLVERGVEMHRTTRKRLRERAGDRPYRGRKLSHEEELTRYRTDMRGNPHEVVAFIDRERRRLGLPDKKLDGSPLIPRSALAELIRLEARHRGKAED
jgi:hypothetical protein